LGTEDCMVIEAEGDGAAVAGNRPPADEFLEVGRELVRGLAVPPPPPPRAPPWVYGASKQATAGRWLCLHFQLWQRIVGQEGQHE
jgi:hypothetical protein